MNHRAKILFTLSFFLVISSSFLSCDGCSRYDIAKRANENAKNKPDQKRTINEIPKKEEEAHIDSIENSPNLSLQELFLQFKSAVFKIYTSDGNSTRQGSGFFISRDGIGISNYHVFKATTKGLEIIEIESGEKFKIQEVLASSEEDDYIVFKINSKHNFNYFNIAPNLSEIGEEVFSIGNPKGLNHTLSTGIISGYRSNKDIVQTTTEITHGSSGGPLLNMRGEVIGITTSGFGEANLNFAININQINYGFKQDSRKAVNLNYKFYSIKKFVDGDTFWIDNGTENGEKIRFIGINTPESRKVFNKEEEYFGKEAKNYVEHLLTGKKVRLEYDIDPLDIYGRTLAYIFMEDGTFLNAKLIKEGYAVVMTVPPNVKYADLFVKLQEEARENNRGLWKR